MQEETYLKKEGATEDDIKANFKNGILTIAFPKEPEKRLEEKRYIPIGE